MNVFNTAQETVPERNVTSRSVRSLCKENNELKVSRMNRILIIPKDTKKLIGISYTPKNGNGMVTQKTLIIGYAMGEVRVFVESGFVWK